MDLKYRLNWCNEIRENQDADREYFRMELQHFDVKLENVNIDNIWDGITDTYDDSIPTVEIECEPSIYDEKVALHAPKPSKLDLLDTIQKQQSNSPRASALEKGLSAKLERYSQLSDEEKEIHTLRLKEQRIKTASVMELLKQTKQAFQAEQDFLAKKRELELQLLKKQLQ